MRYARARRSTTFSSGSISTTKGSFKYAVEPIDAEVAPDRIRDNELHHWSIAARELFWDTLWEFCDVIGDRNGPVLVEGDTMADARFFPESRLNFAENLLRSSGREDALVFRGEDKLKMRLRRDELLRDVSRLQQTLAAAGVKSDDRVAAMMPNMPQTIVGMLATASIRAVWASCSPDFGERAVQDRFGQIEPKVLIACDGYWYADKRIELADKLCNIAEQLQPEHMIIVDYLGDADAVAARIPVARTYEASLGAREAQALAYTRVAPDHPLYIMFSSGTTGVPKCIVHSQGGTLLQHLKEHRLHSDIKPGGRVFYFTTCGWMMWNWLASALASDAALMLYDGSPFHPDGNVLFDYAAEEHFTFFGTSTKFINSIRNAGLSPANSHDLSALRAIASTGSPLAPENFRFAYSDIKERVHLASISGGTDIVSCFVLGVPMLVGHTLR